MKRILVAGQLLGRSAILRKLVLALKAKEGVEPDTP
jgi:hypothetical protein